MRWAERVRTFTNQAVKQGAAALGQTCRWTDRSASCCASSPIQNQRRRCAIRRASSSQPTAGVRSRRRLRHVSGERGRALIGELHPRTAAAAAAVADGCGAFAALAAALPDVAAPPSSREISVGEVIADRYEMRRLIGTGPAYRVYAAWHRAWAIEVVLKLPRRDAAAWPALPPAVLSREALRWTGLGLHPHVVYCHYVDCHDDLPLLVVEARTGGTLRPWIAGGRTAEPAHRPQPRRSQICHGLERAHGEGLWHGGLRPENLLLRRRRHAGDRRLRPRRRGASAARRRRRQRRARRASSSPTSRPSSGSIPPRSTRAPTCSRSASACTSCSPDAGRTTSRAGRAARRPIRARTAARCRRAWPRCCVAASTGRRPTGRSACATCAPSCAPSIASCSAGRARSPPCRSGAGTPTAGTTRRWRCTCSATPRRPTRRGRRRSPQRRPISRRPTTPAWSAGVAVS